jgi:hypothetical protein
VIRRVVVASSLEQARLAARRLGLPEDGWTYAQGLRDVAGVAADRLVLVEPVLRTDAELEALRAEVDRRCFDQDVAPTVVTT